MALLDIGRVCRKTAGRDAWSFCVIIEKAKDGVFEVVKADGSKSKVSGKHLEPTCWTVPGKDIPKELSELNLV